ncbi:hypothetical protein JHK85_055873 [Glycine max]|nr:hypothetical protein JHK86_054901 [Glycine max]KAG4917592.1 hypothetical protein JHK85_055873 [Glycine max]
MGHDMFIEQLVTFTAATLPEMALFPSSLSEIPFFEIRNDNRPIVPFNQFGFTHKGLLELGVSKISLSNSNLDLSKVSFFLCTLDSWLHVIQQLEDGEIWCALQSDLIKSIYSFNSLNGKDSFSILYKEETDAD